MDDPDTPFIVGDVLACPRGSVATVWTAQPSPCGAAGEGLVWRSWAASADGGVDKGDECWLLTTAAACARAAATPGAQVDTVPARPVPADVAAGAASAPLAESAVARREEGAMQDGDDGGDDGDDDDDVDDDGTPAGDAAAAAPRGDLGGLLSVFDFGPAVAHEFGPKALAVVDALLAACPG
jgi:hypothetical protein